jgi:hypothetical protein
MHFFLVLISLLLQRKSKILLSTGITDSDDERMVLSSALDIIQNNVDDKTQANEESKESTIDDSKQDVSNKDSAIEDQNKAAEVDATTTNN